MDKRIRDELLKKSKLASMRGAYPITKASNVYKKDGTALEKKDDEATVSPPVPEPPPHTDAESHGVEEETVRAEPRSAAHSSGKDTQDEGSSTSTTSTPTTSTTVEMLNGLEKH